MMQKIELLRRLPTINETLDKISDSIIPLTGTTSGDGLINDLYQVKDLLRDLPKLLTLISETYEF